MKKRTLVCFLIFTLCVFYTAIPNTVFGQEEGNSLAQEVYNRYEETLLDDDVQSKLPLVLEALSDPATLENSIIKTLGGFDAAIDELLENPSLIRFVMPDASDEVIALLGTDEIQTMFKDPDVRTLLQDTEAVKELAALLPAPPGDGMTPTPDDGTTPTPDDGTTPTPDDGTTPTPDDGTTPTPDDGTTPTPDDGTTPTPDDGTTPTPDDGTTPTPDDGTTPTPDDGTTPTPGDGTTPTPDDGTTPTPDDGTTPTPDDGTTPPDVVTPPTVTVPMAEAVPFESTLPISGTVAGNARLGGLSINNVSGRQFLQEIINNLGPEVIDSLGPFASLLTPKILANIAIGLVPDGFLPKKQLEQIRENLILSDRLTPFAQNAPQLDSENFGNAITPNFADLVSVDDQGKPTLSSKYLTSDSLHVYTRVPKKVGGVTFSLSGRTPVQGREVTRDEFQMDTIPYTFRLEETLAATNLPAWPNSDTQLFFDVKLRYSDDGPMGDYTVIDMEPIDRINEDGINEVVWEVEVGIPPSGSVYYYFEVALTESVRFKTLDRNAVLDSTTVTLDDVLNATRFYEIKGWAMPDPRNLQLADRGIIDKLFTSELESEFSEMVNSILNSPEAAEVLAPILTSFLASGQLDVSLMDIGRILQLADPKQLSRIQSILEGNSNELITQFESKFDPLLASVFSVPHVDLETESLWVARIPNIADGNYYLGATILDADGNPLDGNPVHIQEKITVDTSAPAADIGINPSDANTTGYWNDDGIFVATAPTAGTPAMLNIMGSAADIGPGRGYLFYQMIGLDENGNLDPNITPNTWEPLTVESTILASRIWNALVENATDEEIAGVLKGLVKAKVVPLPQGLDISVLDDATLASLLRSQTIYQLLSVALTVENIQGPVDMFLKKNLEPFLPGASKLLSDAHYQLIVDALGFTVDLIDHLVPVTIEPSEYVTMPIQGPKMALAVGDYGIRAMGIDTLFNVGAYAKHTHLRIVAPVYDKATVTAATIADQYRVGEDGYEIGTIYANTTEGVMLTGTIERTLHPVTVSVQYVDATGNWANIGPATVMDDGTFEISWNVSDFDALLDAGATVNVQAIATNKLLQLPDPDPMVFSINLDGGIYPPEVLDIVVDSIEKTNPDSGGPQGVVIIKAYTLSQTGPETVKVRFELTQSDGTTIPFDPVENGVPPTDLADTVQAALASAIGGTNASVNPDDYHEWELTVDTTTLDDTITKDSPGARDASKDDNQYTIRAFAVSMDEMEWPSDKTEMLSVDNVDDVGPLGPTNITTIANADSVIETVPNGDGSYILRGLIDANDPSVVSPVAKFTIETKADPKTYESVKLVTVPEINADLIQDPVPAGEGVFEITVDVGALGIEGNGEYTLHAETYDEFGNPQDLPLSPKSTVHVKNYLRPDPAVFKIAVDVGTEKNADSEGPQGTFMFTGYTIEQNSPPITSIRLEAKRAGDTDWTIIGTGDASTSIEIEDAALPGVLDHLTSIAVEGTEVGNRSVVAIDATYHEWAVSVDTIALGLADSITNTSPGARDVSLDDNPYTVRAFAVDGSGKEWASDATEMFSLDNVDDVAPLGPTNVSVTSVEATDNSVFEDAGDGSYTVGGLVDKHDDAVASPVATLTLEPTAARKTYDSVTLVPDTEGLVVTEVAETSVGSGVFTVTVDVGTLADGEYLENGIYMFHALAFDELGNVQADMSETDGSRISVTVANTYRPAPQVLAFTVGDPTKTNPDSGAPQETISLYGYSPEITSAPTTSVVFEVKRKNDTEWKAVGTASESNPVTAADDAKLAAANVADVAGENVVTSDTYQRWMIQVDTTTLEDSITAESPGARDHTKDDNQYMVRATAMAEADGSANLSVDGVTAMFSVDNVDDVAPLGPTNVSVTSVDAIDSVLEAAEDGSYTVGGLVDKYDEAVPSPVATFTLKPTADRKTYKSVRFVPGIENLVVTEVTETGKGSGVFTVTVDVGTLADMKTYLENGTYMFYALAFDEFGNEQADDSETDGSKISVTVENSYRPAPEVLAIAVDPESITQTNPDSGAPQGTITLNSRSYEITSPPISGMRFEVKRKNDTEWIDVGTATESMLVDVSDAELADVVGNLASIAVDATEANESGEATVVPINRTYQEWMIEVDTTTLEDTITADSPAARDASKDDNQYMVRAVAIAEADGSETLSADSVTAMFSVDNVDDVPPVGPTNIVAVADVASMIEANEDGSYTVGGIVDDTVPTPIAIFTTEPAADPITYASVNLVQTTEDGTETITMGEAGVLDIMIDVGTLENGTYMFHALAVDEFGNVQTDESPMITVHVLNFRVSDVTDLAVIAVDGTDVPEPPAEPIPLRESVTVTFMVANGSLAAEELSGAVNGSAVPSEGAEDPENTFSIKVEVGALTDGVYTPDGVVTKRNGSVAFPLTTVNVDNTGPMVTIESPTEDETVDSLPTIRATYHDGAGSGVDGATGNLALARLQPNEVEVVVDQADLEKDAESLVYTRREPIAGGAYRVTVQVTDNLGNVGEGSAEFAVNGTAPMVAIHSPAAGQTFEHGEPYISGEFSGIGTVEVTTFTINDVDATPEVEGNQFSYTSEEALTNDNYTVVVAVTDGDGNMAQTSVTFVVDIPEPPEPPKDTTPPVISTVAPSGLIKLATHGDVITLSAVVTDEQSDVASVRFSINGGPSRSVSAAHIKAGEISISQLLEPGLHTAEVVATSRGGTTKHSWVFTLVFDDVKPTITSITPSGTIRGGLPVISASASDESGIDKMTITVMDSDGKEVKGKTADDGEDTAKGISRLDFNPDVPLEEGTYTIEVRATDTIGNSASAKENFTIDFDTAAPIITMASPQNNARLIYAEGEARRPTISISYADAETGINVESIRFVFNDELTNLTSEQKSASQVTYIPPKDLDPGQYSVKLEVFDRANEEGNVSDKSKGAREANMAVYEFTFSVEEKDGPILAARPLNYPNPFKDKTRISFTLARQATVSIVIYDATMRPVRVLVDNRVFDAGNYTRKDNGSDAIGWDGTSSSGEDLARGIYFCEIIVADGFEPEYAILKLALTR